MDTDKNLFSEHLLTNFYIAVDAVKSNKTRSILTALGIIFGVAAVISMLAIGNGAQKEILEQIKLVGLNNIVIKPIVKQEEARLGEDPFKADGKQKFTPGLNLRDVAAISKIIPNIERVSPEVLIETNLIKNGIRRTAKLIGVEPAYFPIFNFELDEGKMFNHAQIERGDPVCIIGKSIKAKFFPTENPIGKSIKCGSVWLKIIGVLKERLISENSISNLGIRDYNMDVYAPLHTVLIRYKNRDLVTQEMIARNARMGDRENSAKNPHQLDKLVIQVSETHLLNPVADVISRMLKRRHYDVVDYEIEIPELLLKQQQRTNDIFNYVLGAIAGISLLVGGIGIMNIMLASVLERIKEIGLRMSIGAKKSDIVNQFMFEAVLISISGGIIGTILGILIAFSVSRFADIPTVVSFTSIIISFGVAAAVGLIFGITPARRAAKQDPIKSLRYE